MSRYKDETPKKRIRIKYRRTATCLSLLLIAVCMITSCLSASAGRGTAYDRDLLTAVGDPAAEAPEIRARAAALYSLDLDRMVYEKNADEKIPPYSITKLLTCYLALENLDPDQYVTASENACELLEEAMLMELEPGEKVKAIDLVYAAMMMSANDGATALGEAVSGDIKSFAELMNQTAAGWGCTNTHFVNANGWDHKDHYTSARDMAIITKNCLENDTLREIAMQKYYTVPATNMSDELFMENALLKTMDDNKYITGGKTGSWTENQCSIALEFRQKGLSAVIVLLDDDKKNRPKDAVKLMEFSHEVTPGFRVTDKGEEVCTAWVKHGARTKAGLTADRQIFVYPENEKAREVKVKTKIDSLEAPLSKGDKAGSYLVYVDGELAAKGDLIVSEDVEKGGPLSLLYIPDRNALMLLIAVALIMLLGFVLQAADEKKAKNKRRVKLEKH